MTYPLLCYCLKIDVRGKENSVYSVLAVRKTFILFWTIGRKIRSEKFALMPEKDKLYRYIKIAWNLLNNKFNKNVFYVVFGFVCFFNTESSDSMVCPGIYSR